MSTGPIAAYMKADHDRLDALRSQGAWWEFRGGLLRHIGLEEKILLPEARRRRGGTPLPEALRLREDHAAIATLLIPTPSPETSAAIERILEPHNQLEEGAGGVYETCDALCGAEAMAIAERLRRAPEVPQSAYFDGPRALAQVERVLAWVAAHRLQAPQE
jgi:hypothetical protein